MALTKKGLAAQDQEFPKVGSPEFQNLQQQAVALLVEREQWRQAAEDLDVEVTEADIDKELEAFIDERFAGKRKDFEKALKAQGFTEDDLRETLRWSVVSRKVFESVTADVEVTDDEIAAYYAQNQANYVTPTSRDLRHILITEKKPNGDIDYAKSKAEAERIHALLEDGGDFAALAKEFSEDGSAAQGGKLTVNRGETVPEFDAVAFDLDKGELSEPVRTQFGYHVIEALSAKPKIVPLAKVRDSIKSTLAQERKNEIIQEWLDDLRADSDVSYAAGFEPPELPEQPTETVTE
jgi:parvulin-like peptidyl-prolyl isomerase